MSIRRLAIVLAIGTSAVLALMLLVTAITGATQEAHEYVIPADAYARGLLEHASGLRLLMGLDVAFLVLYTGFFTALAAYLGAAGRPLTTLALCALGVTAVLDIVEDHQILSALGMAEQRLAISDAWIGVQQIVSSTKFSVSYVALFTFGLAIPRTTRLGLVLSLVLTAGTLVTAVLGHAAPIELRATLDLGRWVGYLVGFVIAAVWLRRQRDSERA